MPRHSIVKLLNAKDKKILKVVRVMIHRAKAI